MTRCDEIRRSPSCVDGLVGRMTGLTSLREVAGCRSGAVGATPPLVLKVTLSPAPDRPAISPVRDPGDLAHPASSNGRGTPWSASSGTVSPCAMNTNLLPAPGRLLAPSPNGQCVPAGLVSPTTRSGVNQRDEGSSSASTRDRIDRAIASTG